jgi:hypothetical protein
MNYKICLYSIMYVHAYCSQGTKHKFTLRLSDLRNNLTQMVRPLKTFRHISEVKMLTKRLSLEGGTKELRSVKTGINTGESVFLRAKISGTQHFIGLLTRDKKQLTKMSHNLLKKLSGQRSQKAKRERRYISPTRPPQTHIHTHTHTHTHTWY